jgi:hypothetical protein
MRLSWFSLCVLLVCGAPAHADDGGAGGDTTADAGTAGGGNDPGLYGCFCSGSGTAGAWLLLFPVALWALRRKRTGVALLVLAAAYPRTSHAEPTPVAVMKLKAGPGVLPEVAEIVSDSLNTEVARRGVKVISAQDAEARVVERPRLLACGDEGLCLAELSEALHARVISGSMARDGDLLVLDVIYTELGSSAAKHATVRVENAKAVFDAIPHVIDQLLPAATAPEGVAGDSPAPPAEPPRTWVEVTARGQLSPFNFPAGAWVVHAAFLPLRSLSVGAGVIIAKPFGAMARISWCPFNSDGLIFPRVSLEVPVMFSAPTAVGLGIAPGVEVRPLRFLAIGAEVPVQYFFTGPTDTRFWLFGALYVAARI